MKIYLLYLFVFQIVITTGVRLRLELVKAKSSESPHHVCRKRGLYDAIATSENISHLSSILKENNVPHALVGSWFNDNTKHVVHSNGAVAPFNTETNNTRHAFCLRGSENDDEHFRSSNDLNATLFPFKNNQVSASLTSSYPEQRQVVLGNDSLIRSKSWPNVPSTNPLKPILQNIRKVVSDSSNKNLSVAPWPSPLESLPTNYGNSENLTRRYYDNNLLSFDATSESSNDLRVTTRPLKNLRADPDSWVSGDLKIAPWPTKYNATGKNYKWLKKYVSGTWPSKKSSANKGDDISNDLKIAPWPTRNLTATPDSWVSSDLKIAPWPTRNLTATPDSWVSSDLKIAPWPSKYNKIGKNTKWLKNYVSGTWPSKKNSANEGNDISSDLKIAPWPTRNLTATPDSWVSEDLKISPWPSKYGVRQKKNKSLRNLVSRTWPSNKLSANEDSSYLNNVRIAPWPSS